MEWRAIPGYERYAVSDTGRVRSLGTRNRPQAMKLHTVDGYQKVSLTCANCAGKKKLFVHRLVLLAFRGSPPPGKPRTRHLNGKSTDNRLTNLKWGDDLENARDTSWHGKRASGERHPKAKLTWAKVRTIRKLLSQGKRPVELGKTYGVTGNLISQIGRKKIWKE